MQLRRELAEGTGAETTSRKTGQALLPDAYTYVADTWSSLSRFASSRDDRWVTPTGPAAAATSQR